MTESPHGSAKCVRRWIDGARMRFPGQNAETRERRGQLNRRIALPALIFGLILAAGIYWYVDTVLRACGSCG